MEDHASTSYATDRNRLLKAIIASALLHLLLLLIKFHFSAPHATSQTQAMARPDLQLHLLPADNDAKTPGALANADQATPNILSAPLQAFDAKLAAAEPAAALTATPREAAQPKQHAIPPQSKAKQAPRATAVAKAQPLPQPPQKSVKLMALEETREDTFTVPPPAEGVEKGAAGDIHTENPTSPQLAENNTDSVVPTDTPIPQPLDTPQQDREQQAQEELARQQEEAQRLAEVQAQQKRAAQQAAEALAAKLHQQAIEEEARRQAALEAQRLAEAQAEQQRRADRQAAEAKAAAALAERLRQQALAEEARRQAALEAKRLAEAQAEQQRLAAKQAEEAKAAAALAAKLRQQALEEEARKQAALEAQRLAEAQAEQQRLAEKQAAEAKAAEARRQAQAEQARLLAAQEAKRIADLQAAAAAAAAKARLAQESAQASQRSVAAMSQPGQQTQGAPTRSQNSAAPASGTAQPVAGNAKANGNAGAGATLAANEHGTVDGKSSSGSAAQGTDLKPASKAIVVQTQHAFLDDSCNQKVTGRHVQIDLYASVWRHQVRLNAPSYLLDYVKALPHVSPIVTVTVRSDGNIEGINFERSSGRPEIDNVIARMVQFLAPFKAFPKDLAVECEVIAFPSIWSINNGLNVTWAGQ